MNPSNNSLNYRNIYQPLTSNPNASQISHEDAEVANAGSFVSMENNSHKILSEEHFFKELVYFYI